MPNGFVADAIFLPRKREGDERGSLEISDRARKQVEDTGADAECDVALTEEGIQGIVWETEVFARAKQEEEALHETIRSGAGGWGVFLVGESNDVSHEGQWKVFDT